MAFKAFQIPYLTWLSWQTSEVSRADSIISTLEKRKLKQERWNNYNSLLRWRQSSLDQPLCSRHFNVKILAENNSKSPPYSQTGPLHSCEADVEVNRQMQLGQDICWVWRWVSPQVWKEPVPPPVLSLDARCHVKSFLVFKGAWKPKMVVNSTSHNSFKKCV